MAWAKNKIFKYRYLQKNMTESTDRLVSVIIPTFNRAEMVTEAVESVLSQGVEGMELIVVDDGSTDGTARALAPYTDSITLLSTPHRGVSFARNIGVNHSTGRYIAFLDSDDLWLPGKLSAQLAFFESNPEALICQTEEIWIKNGKRIHPKPKHKKPSGMIFEKSLKLCLVSPSAVMMKKELFLSAKGFDTTLPACEDYDLWLRISCAHPVYLLPRPLVIKRGGHDGQLSSMPCLDKYRIYAIKKTIDTCGLSKEQRLAAISELRKKCEIYASGCEKRGRTREASLYRKLAESYSP